MSKPKRRKPDSALTDDQVCRRCGGRQPKENTECFYCPTKCASCGRNAAPPEREDERVPCRCGGEVFKARDLTVDGAAIPAEDYFTRAAES